MNLKFYHPLSLFILLASFFLFTNNVKAQEVNIQLYDSDLQFIDETFLQCRDLAINYANNNNKLYFITRSSGTNYVIFINNTNYTGDDTPQSIYYPSYFSITLPYNSRSYFACINNNLVSTSQTYGRTFSLTYTDNKLRLWLFLDSNVSFPLSNTDTQYTINISSGDYTYTFSNGENMPSLYTMYSLSSNPHDSELALIGDFYSTFIDRLSYLCSYIYSNYILLSVLVVFIFIYTILLFRRLK